MCFSFVFITAFRGCLPVGRLLLLYYIILDREGFVFKKVTPIEDFLWSISILTDPGVDIFQHEVQLQLSDRTCPIR